MTTLPRGPVQARHEGGARIVIEAPVGEQQSRLAGSGALESHVHAQRPAAVRRAQAVDAHLDRHRRAQAVRIGGGGARRECERGGHEGGCSFHTTRTSACDSRGERQIPK